MTPSCLLNFDTRAFYSRSLVPDFLNVEPLFALKLALGLLDYALVFIDLRSSYFYGYVSIEPLLFVARLAV